MNESFYPCIARWMSGARSPAGTRPWQCGRLPCSRSLLCLFQKI